MTDIMFLLLNVNCVYAQMADPFMALNVNCFNTVNNTNFRFDKHVSRDSPDMTPYIFFQNGMARVT